jgi:hypothetical protein
MHVHFDIYTFLFIGLAMVAWRHILPLAAASAARLGLPGANAVGQFVTA